MLRFPPHDPSLWGRPASKNRGRCQDALGTKGAHLRPAPLSRITHPLISPLDPQPNSCTLPYVLNAVFKALADESRRKLLDELSQDSGQNVGDLCKHLDMTRQAVAKHLALLESANLVATIWRGREKLHYLNPAPLHELSEQWLGKYERQRLESLSTLKAVLAANRREKPHGKDKKRLNRAHEIPTPKFQSGPE